ncbi:STAS/SEC14 domain-containing protein [Arthrobacter sp. KBS0702]|jgi:hypothetical protein|uniref:DUF7793 family protein n=1 Tax=Arthrobacter sp. KBS0702 TaxID=2578107 RepID=UPI00110ED236|nr:STAS/SEC14 domain-containing protein [Arthrobacter sp. KBS0702]QDW30659.1 STAS/SEC14 domain-containing protein [Arthrobacter sp. KBS0702]
MEIVLAAGKGTLSLDEGGILQLVWAGGSALETADAAESVLAISKISAGRMLPLLIDISDVKLSAGARNHYLESRFVSSVALVGQTNVDRVVAAWMRRGNECPQRYFTSTADALQWLAELGANDGATQNVPG